MRMIASSLLALAAVVAVAGLALAEETIIEKRIYERQQHPVEVAPPPAVQEHVDERTITTEPPAVQRRTDTVTTTRTYNDDDND